MRTSFRFFVFGLALVAVSACAGREGAYGDANSIVAAADPELWASVEESVYAALEPTILTVRDEKTFTVTWQDPSETEWGNLRKFQQMLLIGSESDPWVEQALDKVSGRSGFAPPEIIQVYDVWARGQTVTILLIPEDGDGVAAVENRLEELNRLYDTQFREFARNRMFISGIDSALADTLREEASFSLLLPNVYDWQVQDSTYLFRNDNPDPAELIRQISVSWMSPIPEGMQGENLLDWRREVAAATTPSRRSKSSTTFRPALRLPGLAGLPDPGGLAECARGELAGGRPLHPARGHLPVAGSHVPHRFLALCTGQGEVRVHDPARDHPRLVPVLDAELIRSPRVWLTGGALAVFSAYAAAFLPGGRRRLHPGF